MSSSRISLSNSSGGSNPSSCAAGVATGWSISFSAGERGVGVSAGLGLGAELSMYETETLESISLTWHQSDNVNSQATSGNTSWSVGNKRQLEDGTWVGNVTIGVGKDKVTTSTLIYSSDEKTWMSKQYEHQAKEAEGLE